MTVALTVNGVVYNYPQQGDYSWGSDATNWASAVTAGMLQKAGGSFTLTAEVDFGATYGLKTAYYKSQNANPASAGQVRLGNTEIIAFRNAANSADLDLTVNGSDELTFNSNKLADFGTVTETEFGYLSGVTSAIQTQIGTKLTNPLTTNGDIIYENSGEQRLAVGSENQLLQCQSGLPAWGPIITDWTATTITGSWTVNTTYVAKYKRIGDHCLFRVAITCTGAPNAALLTLTLPASISIDSSKLQSTSGSTMLGIGSIGNYGITHYPNIQVIYGNGTNLNVYIGTISGSYVSSTSVSNSIPFAFNTNDIILLNLEFPAIFS